MSFKLNHTWAEISLDNLDYNIKKIKASVPDSCKVMCIVKADAYGHGDAEIANFLQSVHGISWFGVSNLDEAKSLRRAGITGDILILGYTPAERAAELSANNITQAVYGLEFAEKLSAEAAKANCTVKIHIKVDTGMGRIGFDTVDHSEIGTAEAEKAATLPCLNASGIFTHFACSDTLGEKAESYTRAQYERFLNICNALENKGIKFEYRHCCNSAGIIRCPEMHLDMVRAGIILYGLTPSTEILSLHDFRPIMELKSKVTYVKQVAEGRCISYGMTYKTEAPRKIATVCVGYADGYSRLLSNKGEMLIKGKRCRVLGRVCMDQLMVDVTDISAKEGDTVTVFGRDGEEYVSVDELAGLTDTINYEITCLLTRRVPRVYKKDGKTVAVVDYIADRR